MKLRLSKPAQNDMVQIRDYTKRVHGRQQALKYVDALQNGMSSISQHAEIGYNVEYLGADYRCYQVEHHRIFYRIEESQVLVTAVLHKSQRPERNLTQREKFE